MCEILFTQSRLRDAYKKCHSNSEREALISNLNAGQNKYVSHCLCVTCIMYSVMQEAWKKHWENHLWLVLGTVTFNFVSHFDVRFVLLMDHFSAHARKMKRHEIRCGPVAKRRERDKRRNRLRESHSEQQFTVLNSSAHHVWPWKRRQGPRKGRRQASQEDPSRQHPGHHQACNPSSGPPWRSQAHLWPHLRGDPRRSQVLPGERDP